MFRVDEAGTVQDAVLQSGHESKVSKICSGHSARDTTRTRVSIGITYQIFVLLRAAILTYIPWISFGVRNIRSVDLQC